MDVIASDSGFMDYDIVVAPMLYMLRPGVADEMKAFVEKADSCLQHILQDMLILTSFVILEAFQVTALKTFLE